MRAQLVNDNRFKKLVNAAFQRLTLGTIHDTRVWLVKTALLDHLILILDQKFDTLDWGSCGLGDTGSNTREHKVLEKVQLLAHIYQSELLDNRNRTQKWDESPC